MTISEAAIHAVAVVAEKFRDGEVPMEQIEGGFSHESVFGPTLVRAVEPRPEARERGVTGVITVETALPEDSGDVSDDELALLNRMSILSATVRRSDGTMLSACRVSVYEGKESALDLQRHLIFGAALIQGEELPRAISYLNQEETDLDDLPAGNDPGGWNAEEFARTARSLYSKTTSSAEGMTAEIPWDDAETAGDARLSSLIRLAVTEHPSCGKGLHFSLDLPLDFEPAELAKICAALNFREYESQDGPPLFGAWCAGSAERNPSFNGFIPNLFYRPFLVERLTGWLIQRSEWAREYFERLGEH